MILSLKEDYTNLKGTTEYTGVHPKKFALWMAMAGMTMFFAALVSAVIFKRGDFKEWEEFSIPSIFLYSTIVIISTSVLFQFSLILYRRANFSLFRAVYALAFTTAILFLFMQLLGWRELTAIGKPITGNISGQFIYLLSYAHAFHIAIGLLVALVFFVIAMWVRNKDVFETVGKVNPERQLHLEMLVSFWHFIDIVWVFLYAFLYMNYR